MTSIKTYSYFIHTIFPTKTQTKSLFKNVILAVVGSLGLTLASKIQIPLYPVPFTMQTYAVVLIGGMYGPYLGVATVVLWLAQGALGLPVWAGNIGGIPILFGTTGGYLFGFILGAFITGWGSRLGHDRSILKSLPWFALSHTLILLLGVAWLTKFIGFEQALINGLYPFVFGALIKLIAASLTLRLLWTLTKKKS